MLKKFILIVSITLLVPVSASALKVLYAGVKINSKPLAEDSFLLTREELNDFLEAKQRVKALEKIISEKDSQIALLKSQIIILVQDSQELSEKTASLSVVLTKSAEDKKSLARKNKSLRRNRRRERLLYMLIIGAAAGKLF